MSSTRQAVVLALSLTDFGYIPVATPCHQVVFDTGKNNRICFNLMKPVDGKTYWLTTQDVLMPTVVGMAGVVILVKLRIAPRTIYIFFIDNKPISEIK